MESLAITLLITAILRWLISVRAHARLPRVMAAAAACTVIILSQALARAENAQQSNTSQASLMQTLPAENRTKAKQSAGKALDFIVAQQLSDGSFPQVPDRRQSAGGDITGFAALALVNHGGLDAKSPYRKPLEKAIDYLLGCQNESGLIKSTPEKSGTIYHHSYATVVLAKARGALDAARNAKIEAALPRAVSLLLAAQKVKKDELSQGGWRYTPTGTNSDISCTAAAVLALYTARAAKVDVPEEAFLAAADYAARLQVKEGGFGYVKASGPGFPRTGMGLFILEAAGRGDTEPARRAIDSLHSRLENLQPENFLYYGIFWGANATAVSATQADRKAYASWLYPYLSDLQADDGSFRNGNLRMVPTIGAALAMAAERP